MNKQGDLRVWWVSNAPNRPAFVPVATPEEAIKIINIEAQKQLKNPLITDNAFGLEIYDETPINDDGEHWSEWYDEETGYDIREYEEMLEEEAEPQTL